MLLKEYNFADNISGEDLNDLHVCKENVILSLSRSVILFLKRTRPP